MPVTARIQAADAAHWPDAAAKVKSAFARAWAGYEAYAFGSDELRPLSQTASERWGRLSITMVDGIDTVWLMGLDAQYGRARQWLLDHYKDRVFSGGDAPFFEVTIRALGGLLSVHTLTGDNAVLDLANELGHRLAPALSKSPSGIPYCTVHLGLGNVSCPDSDLGQSIPLAELGSVQLEFAALRAALSADPPPAGSSWPMAALPDADNALRAVRRLPALHGLYPTRMRPQSGGPASKEVGFGSGTDSFYETLLKRWIQGGKREVSGRTPKPFSRSYCSPHRYLTGLMPMHVPVNLCAQDWLREMYRDSLVGLRRLLRRSHPSNLLFVARANGGEVGMVRPRSHVLRDRHTFEHLSCFLPGMLALGAHHRAGINATWEWEVARELLHTCATLYRRQPAGLGPERVAFVTQAAMAAAAAERDDGLELTTDDYDVHDSQWPLRPEYVESLYVMNALDPLVRRPGRGGEAADKTASQAGGETGGEAGGEVGGEAGGEAGGETSAEESGQSAGTEVPSYRHLGLAVLEAIERQCRTDSGYAALRTTSQAVPAATSPAASGAPAPAGGAVDVQRQQANSLESFFFAETLKYLFLLFADPASLPAALDLDRYVFTTEAHVLPCVPGPEAAEPRSAATASGEEHPHRRVVVEQDGNVGADSEPVGREAERTRITYPPWWRDDGLLDD